MLKFHVEAGKFEYDGDDIFEDCDYCDSFETFELAYAAYEKYGRGLHWARIIFSPCENAPVTFDVTPQRLSLPVFYASTVKPLSL
ncbi:hypothetical protein [Pseudomonas phage TC6]|uniref:Uncharacterized protein n=1 Tax=Pseudomonas phage TC6 TaxID=2060947 RepID=A0A2H5BQG6_9CAUD|nr:hypothetical protein [Pseudomonas phage TC6]